MVTNAEVGTRPALGLHGLRARPGNAEVAESQANRTVDRRFPAPGLPIPFPVSFNGLPTAFAKTSDCSAQTKRTEQTE
jgi:hypothetical protein